MSQTISIQGAVYSDVPAIDLPKDGGGTARFMDVTDTTASASNVANGYYFYASDGTKTQGSAVLATATVSGTVLTLTNGFPISV